MPLAPREYSKRLGTLTHAQLERALARFDLGELRAAELAPGGLFGQNVFLSSSRGEFVLRGAPHADWQFPKERFFARQLHALTDVRVPWPYRMEESPEIFGWGFALLPKLPGASLSNPDTAAALGAGLSELHAAVWPFRGDYDLAIDDIRPAADEFADAFVARLRGWLSRCREASDATTDADAAWVETIVARLRPALPRNAEFQPTFVHGDYSEGNALVEYGDSGWRVSGVLDLMTMDVGDPEEDLVRMLAHYSRVDRRAASRFLDAYRALRPLRPGFEERIPLYALADSLLFWEYGQRNRIWFRAGQCLREFAERFLELELRSARP